MLRKTGAVLKWTITLKKRAPGQINTPPTPQDLKRKLLANKLSSSKGTTGTYQNTAGNKTKRNRIMENEDNSYLDDYLPLAAKLTMSHAAMQTTTRMNVTEPHGSNSGASIELWKEATSSGGQPIETTTILPSNYETATDYTLAREADIKMKQQRNCRGKFKGGGARRCRT